MYVYEVDKFKLKNFSYIIYKHAKDVLLGGKFSLTLFFHVGGSSCQRVPVFEKNHKQKIVIYFLSINE